MVRIRRRIATVGIAPATAVALALALAACGGGVKNSAATSSAKTGTTGQASGSQTGTGTGTAVLTASTTTPTTTGAANGTAAAALAQQTVRVPNSKDATVDIDVLGLAVQGQLATLTVRFTPHFPSQAGDASVSLYDMSDNAISQDQVSLVDPVGLKRYLVVRDADNNWLGADEVDTRAVNNSSVVAHWTFAAPPASVSKLDVDLGPFPAMNDVPISR